MKVIFSCLLILFAFPAVSQTCIVIYVSHNGIVAGADRKYHQTFVAAGNSNGKKQTADTVYYGKKIFIAGDVVWAISGADYLQTIHTVCNEACIKKASLKIILRRFRESLREERVQNAVHHLCVASNAEQKKRFKENLAEVAFFKWDGCAFKAYRVTLSMPGIFSNNETLHAEADSIVATKNTVGIFVMGHYESFASNTHPETWTHPAATIRSLIKQQSVFTPAEVSAQSDILQISRTGFAWITGIVK